MNTIITYIQESIAELHKVRWPTRQQAIRLSMIVIGFVAITSVLLGFIDYLLSQVISFLINL